MHSEYVEQRNGGYYVAGRVFRWTRLCMRSTVAIPLSASRRILPPRQGVQGLRRDRILPRS